MAKPGHSIPSFFGPVMRTWRFLRELRLKPAEFDEGIGPRVETKLQSLYLHINPDFTLFTFVGAVGEMGEEGKGEGEYPVEGNTY